MAEPKKLTNGEKNTIGLALPGSFLTLVLLGPRFGPDGVYDYSTRVDWSAYACLTPVAFTFDVWALWRCRRFARVWMVLMSALALFSAYEVLRWRLIVLN